MRRVRLTIAATDYDHFRDFRTGLVQAEGIDPIWLTLGHHEIFARFTLARSIAPSSPVRPGVDRLVFHDGHRQERRPFGCVCAIAFTSGSRR